MKRIMAVGVDLDELLLASVIIYVILNTGVYFKYIKHLKINEVFSLPQGCISEQCEHVFFNIYTDHPNISRPLVKFIQHDTFKGDFH